jgi:LDH2 family malate/lactate/ureidoglycolate dehydrogenase
MGAGFVGRIEADLQAMVSEPGVRLPGDNRLASRAHTAVHGVEVPDDLMAVLTSYVEPR